MIGPFPWQPFPPGEPDPKGPDPVHSLAFRSAVTAADAYHAVRLAVRRESGTLRIGNRFVSDQRYREVGFLAFGNAANSMGLGALHALGDRLTQGFLAGPDPVTAELPFRGTVVPPGWPGFSGAAAVVAAARELGEGLEEPDLLLVLLSPGALRALAEPPPGATPEEFARLLELAFERGATGREVGLLARVLGTGAVGGRLAAAAPRADVITLAVERGDGVTVLGGGPMRPVDPAERVEARAVLTRTGLDASIPAESRDALTPGGPSGAGPVGPARPVVVAGPPDALRASADSVFDKGWTVRLAFLELYDPPEAAAEKFLARSEELYLAERIDSESRTKGVATFAMTTLGQPEGLDDGPALGRFLTRAGELARRREMSVGLFRTGGAVPVSSEPALRDVGVGTPLPDGAATAEGASRSGEPVFPPGAVIGAPTEPDRRVVAGRARAVRMRRGITDVGALAVALFPRPGPTS